MCVICRHLLNNYKVHDTCIQILCIGPWLVNIDLLFMYSVSVECTTCIWVMLPNNACCWVGSL